MRQQYKDSMDYEYKIDSLSVLISELEEKIRELKSANDDLSDALDNIYRIARHFKF
jgi:tetrahydromethanopterin S-methyltransferase subunit B